jgi:hypothetical protein
MRSVCECSCGLDGRGIVVRLTAAEGYLYRLQIVRPDMGPIQPHIQSVPGVFFQLRAKWPKREANRLPPSSAEVKN